MAIQSQPSRIPEPFAGSGTKNTIPATNTTPSASQAASWASGFPPECSQPISAGGCPVPRNDVNGALNQISQDFAFRQDGGIWTWSALADYDVQRMVRGSDGLLYWSVQQSGPGLASGAVDPTTDDGTYWSSPALKTMPLSDKSAMGATTEWVKELAVAPVYVDAVNGSDSNGGFSASDAVQTIDKALEIAFDKDVEYANLNIAPGTYTEDIILYQKNISVTLLGNVTISGCVNLNHSSFIVEPTDNSLSLSSSSAPAFAVVNVSNSSSASFGCHLNITNTGITAVNIGYNSFAHIIKDVTISSTSAPESIFICSTKCFLRVEGAVAISGSLNVGSIIEVFGCSFAVFDGAFTCSQNLLSGTSPGFLCSTESALWFRGAVTAYGVTDNSCNFFVYCTLLSLMRFGESVNFYFSPTSGSSVVGSHDHGFVILGKGASLQYANISTVFDVSNGSGLSVDSGSLSFNGSTTYSTVSSQYNSSIDIRSSVTVSGTSTGGRRYTVARVSVINVHGAGANRIPGASSGHTDTATYGLYV